MVTAVKVRKFLTDGNHIREIDPSYSGEMSFVISRMRQALIEGIGAATGDKRYTDEWLRENALRHLDPAHGVGQIFVAEDRRGVLTGQIMVGLEDDAEGNTVGRVSTVYVDPSSRNRAIASNLVMRAEHWMMENGVFVATVKVSRTNTKAQRMFAALDYEVADKEGAFVMLTKTLTPPK